MKIFTSYHAQVQQLIEMGLTPISISVQFPKYSKIKYAQYKELAPTFPMLKMDWPEYNKAFQEILSNRNPVRVHSQLKNLSQGKDIVLVCYERNLNECHREQVGKWLEQKLQINVEEVTFKANEKKSKPSASSNQINLF